MIGVATEHCSGKNMRIGGISAALAARVPEAILFSRAGTIRTTPRATT
jgi:hypothetical protein